MNVLVVRLLVVVAAVVLLIPFVSALAKALLLLRRKVESDICEHRVELTKMLFELTRLRLWTLVRPWFSLNWWCAFVNSVDAESLFPGSFGRSLWWSDFRIEIDRIDDVVQ